MKVATLRNGDRLEIGSPDRCVQVSEIDPRGRWVKLRCVANEHITVVPASKQRENAGSVEQNS